jgi:hypothetical protein
VSRDHEVQAVARRGTTKEFQNLAGDGRTGLVVTGRAGLYGAERGQDGKLRQFGEGRGEGEELREDEPRSKEVDPGDARNHEHLPHSSAKGRSTPATARYKH